MTISNLNPFNPSSLENDLGNIVPIFNTLIDQNNEVPIKNKTVVESFETWYSQMLIHLKKMEEKVKELKENNYNYSVLLENEKEKHIEVQSLANIGTWEFKLEHQEVYFSEGLQIIYCLQNTTPTISFSSFLKFVHPSDKSYFRKNIDKAIYRKGSFDFFYRILLPNEDIKVLHARGRVLSNGFSKAHSLVGTSQDVTKRMLQEKRFKDLMEAAPDSVLSLDSKGKIIDWNRKAEQMFGWRQEEIADKKFLHEIIDFDTNNLNSGIFEINKSLLNKQLELVASDKFNKKFPVEITFSELERDDKHIFIGFIRDITQREKNQREIREKKELYSTVVESLSEGLVITNSNDEIQFVNSGILKLTGYEFRDLVGKDAETMFLHPTEYHKKKDRLERRLKGLTESYELRICKKDGSSFWANINAAPYKDGRGNIIGTVGVITDITTAKQKNELESLVLAATKSHNSVIITDSKGKIEWVNDGFTLLTGYAFHEVINKSVDQVRGGDDSFVDYLTKINFKKKYIVSEFENKTKDGKDFWVLSTISPVMDSNGKIERIITIDSDISMRKKMEQELTKAKNISEEALSKANMVMEDLVRAKKQVEESAKAKEKFLANMSHEIRTPMNGIIGLTNVLLKTSINQEQLDYLEAIKTSGDTLMVVINDILDLSKIEAGKMALEKIPFNLNNLTTSLVELLKYKATEKNISFINSFNGNTKEEYLGDPARLTQILTNVISNALKFTNKGQVELLTEMLTLGNQKVEICFHIIDTGRGIPADKLDDIFKDYTQVNAEVARKYGGTGLGLAITKKLVELHGGKIAVKSELKKGTTFSISIVYDKNQKERVKKNALREGNILINSKLQGSKILLVEDNPINKMLANKVLGDWGCKVIAVDNGKIALEELLNHLNDPFDIILMDIKMPELDGYETTKIIRNDFPERIRNTPIIAQTAHAGLWDTEKCIECGMNDFVTKPIQVEELQEKLLKLIRIDKN